MLSVSAVESTNQLAKQLDEKGIALVAKPGSLLGRLVSATYIDTDIKVTEGGYAINTGAMVTNTDAVSPITGFSEHSARMEETADFLARQLEGYLLHARTVAAPFIDDYAKRIQAQIELIGAAPSAGANIKIRRGNNLLLEPALMDAYQRSRDVIHESLNHDYLLPEMTEAQILQLMRTGNTVVDQAIMEHYSAHEEGYLLNLYEDVFRNGKPGAPAVADLIERKITGRQNVDNAIAVFLIARRLWNAPPEGTQMPLAKYEAAMVDLRNQAALRMCYEYDNILRDGNSGVLVTSVRRVGNDYEIEVNKDQYDLYLKQGGSADALFGNQLQVSPRTLTADILENQKVYEAAWARQYNANKSYYDQRLLLRAREAVVSEWYALAESCSQEDFPISERHVAATLVRRYAEEVSLEDLCDVPLLALNLACKCRFRNTADKDLLLGMRRAKKNNPSISAQEAATISLMEYLYKWVADNMEVVPANKVNVFGPQDHMHS